MAISCRFKVSTDALLRTFEIQPMDTRGKELTARFLHKILERDPENDQTPAGRIARSTRHEIETKSILYGLEGNQWFTQRPMKDEDIRKMRKKDLEMRNPDKANVIAKAIKIRTSHKEYNIVEDHKVERETLTAIVHWKVGEFTYHQPCKICSAELSRAHGIECSGSTKIAEAKIPGIMDEWRREKRTRMMRTNCS